MTHRSLSAATLVFALLPAVSAQNQNVTLLGQLDSRAAYAGCYGMNYNDREYIFLGERTGTQVIDVTNPATPVEVGYFTAASSTWREIVTWRNFAYSVSENHGGIRVIEMTPSGPVDRGVTMTPLGSWTNTHSISIDPDTGKLFANGTNLGMIILDAAASPTAPVSLGRYTVQYVHDAFFRRGLGILCHVNNTGVRFVNATNLPTITDYVRMTSAQSLPHNAWMTDDNRLALVTHETTGGDCYIYDITNPANPVQQGIFAAATATVHNIFGIGRTAYLASYNDGCYAFDISNPTAPRQFARYDTNTNTGTGYTGDWGAYPWLDSGVIAASDMSNGLVLFQINCGHLNRFGTGTAGTNGRIPQVSPEGASALVGASAFELRLRDAVPSSACAWLLGAQANLQFGGINLYVDPTLPFLLFVTPTDANGKSTLALPIPNDPSLGNARLYAQAITIDAGGPQGLAASRGLWFGICP